jgi:O-antigen/teichoic acid export membrane protein
MRSACNKIRGFISAVPGRSQADYKMRTSGSYMVLVQRAWQAFAGVVTLASVAHFLTPVEQGYFYTMSSIAALYMVLDMGLSTVLVQFAAREFIGLSWSVKGKITGDQPSRFLALTRMSFVWYGLAGVIFLLICPLGTHFIESGQRGDLAVNWHGPWVLLVCSTAAGLFFLPALALTEGSGEVAEAYKIRLCQGIAGAIAAWTALAMGVGLYAVAMMPAMSALVAAVWLFARRRYMVVQALEEKSRKFQWGRDVWPLQWRIGASWLAGYALVSMHVPLLFRTQGPTVAGQMGVTITVANMLSILAMSWMTARIPAMVQAIFEKNWPKLDDVFRHAFRRSSLAYLAGAFLFIVFRIALEWTPYGHRFLSVADTAGLLLSMMFYHLAGLLAAYLRAFLKEPFLLTSLIGASMTAIAAILCAPRWGASGIIIILVIINGLFFFPIAWWLRRRLRQKWQHD